MSKKNLAIIPARMGSTRFPGKPLAQIAGKPMIQRVYERVCLANSLDEIIVATDSSEIFTVVENFGAKVVMTSPTCPTGLDRVIEASTSYDEYSHVVNIQGDEPIIDPATIDGVLSLFKEQPGCEISTAAIAFQTEIDFKDENQVKVVFDKNRKAMYFSRSPIPYNGFSKDAKNSNAFKHLGIYAYTMDILRKIKHLAPCTIENMEKLEQLRFLHNGISLYVYEARHDSIGVDTPEDITKVEKLLKEMELN
ncbi:MAG: 3-deoxy-manno-octulosonate cytidylyltransferase [Leptospirales bacterium]